MSESYGPKRCVAFRWSLWLGMVLLLTSACHRRTSRYSAFEDLGVSSYTVNLHTNGKCAVEIGLGYHEGRYTQQGDTLSPTRRACSRDRPPACCSRPVI
jgi:hypothetical protein